MGLYIYIYIYIYILLIHEMIQLMDCVIGLIIYVSEMNISMAKCKTVVSPLYCRYCMQSCTKPSVFRDLNRP